MNNDWLSEKITYISALKKQLTKKSIFQPAVFISKHTELNIKTTKINTINHQYSF